MNYRTASLWLASFNPVSFLAGEILSSEFCPILSGEVDEILNGDFLSDTRESTSKKIDKHKCSHSVEERKMWRAVVDTLGHSHKNGDKYKDESIGGGAARELNAVSGKLVSILS